PCGKARISSIRHRFQRLSQRKGQVTHVLLTRSPLIHQVQAPSFSVRLACVKHAASVRPEPGSNSPYKAINTTHTTQHGTDRKSTRLNSSHVSISYAVFC